MHCPETLVTDYQPTPCNIPEDHRPKCHTRFYLCRCFYHSPSVDSQILNSILSMFKQNPVYYLWPRSWIHSWVCMYVNKPLLWSLPSLLMFLKQTDIATPKWNQERFWDSGIFTGIILAWWFSCTKAVPWLLSLSSGMARNWLTLCVIQKVVVCFFVDSWWCCWRCISWDL
jgi:hypothetical protein